MKRHAQTLTTGALCLALAACGHVATMQEDIEKQRLDTVKSIENPMKVAPEPKVVKNERPLVPLVERPLPRAGTWLRSKTISINIINPVPLSQVVEMLATRGIPVISEIPIENTYYSGTIAPMDAETALQIILGSCGLDFVSDETTRIVRIKPMPSRTWYLNLGQRRTRFASGSSGSATSSASTSTAQSSGAFGSTTTSSGSGSSSTSGSSSGGSSGSGGEVSVSSSDDFWTSLQGELDRRLNVLVPSSRYSRAASPAAAPATDAQGANAADADARGSAFRNPLASPAAGQNGSGQAATATPAGGQDLYAKKVIGSYSINPETGSVMVQAPNWVLSELDGYFTRVQQMYNTDITFTGELVLLSKSRNDSEGLDISAFAQYARKYGAVISNNALGGVTVGFKQNADSTYNKIPTITDNATVGGPRLGLYSPTDGLQLFNAWLAQKGDASVIQRPIISTTSGIPAEFSKTVTRYYNTVNQQTAAGGTGSAAVGTQNTLVPVSLGTTMKINPRFDLTTGLIRAQISFTQAVQSGTQNIVQRVSDGSGLASVNVSVPVVSQIAYSGETLLRDGDIIIVGGQTEENLTTEESGLPEEAGFLNQLLGTKRAERTKGTFYLALKVQITPR